MDEDRKVPLWRVKGDGKFFHTFYVPAANLHTASARASDALAGSDAEEPQGWGYGRGYGFGSSYNEGGRGKRFYNTVEKHIVSITRTDLMVEDA